MIRAVIPPHHPHIRIARRLAVLFLAALLFLSGVATGLFLVGYQMRVATQHLSTWGARLVLLEQAYQQDHTMRVTKAQAQTIVATKE